MKNIILLLLFTLISINLLAQININKPQEEKKEIKENIQPYDSLSSLNSHNIMQHVGQTLFLRGNLSKKEEGGFWCAFYTKPNKNYSLEDKYVYKPTSKMVAGKNRIITDYDSVINKYYLVTNIAIGEENETYKYAYYCMELKEKEYGDILYYIVRVSTESDKIDWKDTDIFLTVGYYEKMKLRLAGDEFYCTGEGQLKDYNTSKYVDIPFKVKLKCNDLFVKTGEWLHNSFYAVMENEKYGKLLARIEEENNNRLTYLISISQYNKCIKRYGNYYGSLIVQGKVKEGMTGEMVIEAYGRPDKINYTKSSYGTQEQWVYGRGHYLYFQNGKLTTIQSY